MAFWTEEQLRCFTNDVVPSISRKGVEAFKLEQSKDPEVLLEALLRTAEAQHLLATHRIAAFNALSGFLDQGLRYGGAIKAYCTKSVTLQRAVNIYLEKSEGFRSGPLQRLLAVLASILRAQPQEQSLESLRVSVLQCLTKILDHDNPSGPKPAMILLTKFLNKSILSSKQLLVHLSEVPETPVYRSREFDRLGYFFVYNILEWIGLSHATISATNLIARFCKLCELTDEFRNSKLTSADLWLDPVRDLLDQDESMLEMLERHTLPDLFRVNIAHTFEALSPTLEKLHRNYGKDLSDIDARLCLMALRKVGSSETFVDENSANSSIASVLASRHAIVTQIAQHLLVHRSSKISISALDIITSAYKVPHHIPGEVLDKIQQSLQGFHAEVDAQARSDFLSVAKRLVSRIELSSSRLLRDIEAFEKLAPEYLASTQSSHEASIRKLGEHQKFAAAYADILADGLRASAPYQQHISCLRIIEVLAESSGCFSWRSKLCFPMSRALLTLVMDPYDDVRAVASTTLSRMLHNAPSETARLWLHERVNDAVLLAEETIRRAQRADLADGYGRLNSVWFDTCPSHFEHVNSLLQKLESDIAIAQEDLSQAITAAPIQGHLIALKYILIRKDIGRVFETQTSGELWESFHKRLRATFHRVWEVVKPILCIDSPDAMDPLEPESAAETGIKDTLSYAWRALKETTALMQAIITAPAYALCSKQNALHYEDYKVIGDLTFLQLAELRHKGAFSTVAQTFTACCIVCSTNQDSAVRGLVSDWFQEMLRCIELKAGAITRRSAGIPSIAVGILIAQKNQSSLDGAVEDLRRIAQLQAPDAAPFAESKLPQVHALNSLKEAMTNSALGSAMEVHIPEMTELAAHCLESKIWAIRNCGLMLLKALIARLTTGSATSSARSSDKYRTYANATYEKFPKLSNLVVELLSRSIRLMKDVRTVDDQNFLCENGLPALHLISGLGVVPHDRQKVKVLLAGHLESQIWNIRVLTARSLSTIISMDEIITAIRDTLSSLPTSTNMLHGYLCCMQEHLQSRPSLAEKALQELFTIGSLLVHPQACPFVLTVYLQNVCLALRKCYEVPQVNFNLSDDASSTNCHPSGLKQSMKDLRQRLNSLQIGDWPVNLRDFIAASTLLLERCDFPVPRNGEIYPLSPHHLSTDIIPSMTSLSLATCNSAKMDQLSTIRVSLDLYFLLRRNGSDAQSCNQALDWVSQLASSYATRTPERLTGATINADVLLTASRLRASSDTMMENERHEDDETFARQLVYHGAAMTWAMIDDRDETNRTRLERLHKYTRMLQLAVHEDSGYAERFAAVASMAHYVPMVDLVKLPDESTEIAVKMYKMLLTALSDDDDEIRDLASEVAYSSLVAKTNRVNQESQGNDASAKIPSCPFNSFAAKEYLIFALTDALGSKPQYLSHCLSAIIGDESIPVWFRNDCKDRQPLRDRIESASSRFAMVVRDKGSVLFEEERASLFVDEVQDMELWKDAFRNAWAKLTSELHSAGPRRLVNQTEEWVLPGLKAMQEYLELNRAASLPRSSVREAFVLGMRFLVLAEALVYAKRAYLHEDVEDMMKELKELRDIGAKKDIDVHWARKLEAILSSSQ